MEIRRLAVVSDAGEGSVSAVEDVRFVVESDTEEDSVSEFEG